jgi:hypothetical protein
MEFAVDEGLKVYLILQVYSPKQIIRRENVLPSDSELDVWMSSFQ